MKQEAVRIIGKEKCSGVQERIKDSFKAVLKADEELTNVQVVEAREIDNFLSGKFSTRKIKFL